MRVEMANELLPPKKVPDPVDPELDGYGDSHGWHPAKPELAASDGGGLVGVEVPAIGVTG